MANIRAGLWKKFGSAIKNISNGFRARTWLDEYLNENGVIHELLLLEEENKNQF